MADRSVVNEKLNKTTHEPTGHEVREDVFYFTDQIVNVIFLGKPGNGKWILIDAGMPKSGDRIRRIAEDRFGKASKPEAILLTHGHFDHVGGLVELINKWRVPVYAHPLEFPFLTGKLMYPEPATPEGKRSSIKLAADYPHFPVNLSGTVLPLPSNNTVPDFADWRWIHTPGHSPGHVSLFREEDGFLLSGDACSTVNLDSSYQKSSTEMGVYGPPPYFTSDWAAVTQSIKQLHDLKPSILIPGHGNFVEGARLTSGLADYMNDRK